MPNLRCGVQTCAYNEEEYCCLNSINVGGTTATKPSKTSCDSFEHKNSGFTSDIKEDPKPEVYIQCKAKNCIYNDEQKCYAEHIDVSGEAASHCDETKCATFKCE